MGKKIGKKRVENEDDQEEIDPELAAELAALEAIRREARGNNDVDEDEGGDDEDGDSEEYGGNEAAMTNRSKGKSSFAYNREGLTRALEDIPSAKLPFLESLQVCAYGIEVPDEHDDLQREMAFYNQALLSASLGREKLQKLGVPIDRPSDFFCENIKTDSHMTRIKDRLIDEEKRMEAFEKRRNRDQNKKFNKQIVELRKQEKSASTKSEIKAISDMRKVGHKRDRDQSSGGQDDDGKPVKSARRKGLDKKYGFGGKDSRKAKISDKKSLNDLSEYSPRGGKFNRRETHSAGRGGGRGGGGRGGGRSGGGRGGGGRGKPSAGGNRPGKANRQKQRTQRSKSA